MVLFLSSLSYKFQKKFHVQLIINLFYTTGSALAQSLYGLDDQGSISGRGMEVTFIS